MKSRYPTGSRVCTGDELKAVREMLEDEPMQPSEPPTFDFGTSGKMYVFNAQPYPRHEHDSDVWILRVGPISGPK